jgi:hypothetical protein
VDECRTVWLQDTDDVATLEAFVCSIFETHGAVAGEDANRVYGGAGPLLALERVCVDGKAISTGGVYSH